ADQPPSQRPCQQFAHASHFLDGWSINTFTIPKTPILLRFVENVGSFLSGMIEDSLTMQGRARLPLGSLKNPSHPPAGIADASLTCWSHEISICSQNRYRVSIRRSTTPLWARWHAARMAPNNCFKQ